MKKAVVLLLHVVYWLMFLALLFLFFIFMVYIPSRTLPKVNEAFNFFYWWRIMAGFAVVPGAITFYTFYTLLFNRFLSRKKFIYFFAAGFITAALAAIVGALVESLPALFGSRFLFGDSYRSALTILSIMSIGAFINGIIGTLIRGFVTWFAEIKTKEELNKKNYELELNLVKSQINPHFLFNTINNIDILISKDAGQASAYLNKLSDIMRFMLYETKTENIPLDKELSYIEKYIELQKIRSANPDYVQYHVTGNTHGLTIAPMVFIPFIENAFKHTENKKAGNNINIEITIMDGDIVFLCENSFVTKKDAGDDHRGMGNNLVRRRLALLYPGKNMLTIDDANNIYKVKLGLKANGH